MSVYDLYQSYLNSVTQQDPTSSEGILNPSVLYQNQSGGSDDNMTGFGAFNNLDPNSMKMMNIDVYDPNQGFRTQSVPTYINASTGMRQTIEGKNVNPMFSNTGATFGLTGMALKALGLTQEPVGGFVPGSIRGIYDRPMDFFSGRRAGTVPASLMGIEDPADYGANFGPGGIDMSAVHDDFGFSANQNNNSGNSGGGNNSNASEPGGSDSMGSFATGGRVGYLQGGITSLLGNYYG